MMELLAFEEQSVKLVIGGPGWTRTKTHYETLANTPSSSLKHQEVLRFLENDTAGTPLDDIYDFIDWCDRSPIISVSGRNFSIVNDAWRTEGGTKLLRLLQDNADMYKMRRHSNEIKVI